MRPLGGLVGANILAQGIAAGGAIAVARLYGPAAVGGAAVIFGVAGVASIVITLRIDSILPFVSDGRDSASLVRLMALNSVVGSAVLGAFGLLPWWGDRFGAGPLLALASLGMSLQALYLAVLTRQRDYRLMAGRTVLVSGGIVVLQLASSMFQAGVTALVLSDAVARASAGLSIRRALRTSVGGGSIAYGNIASLLRKYLPQVAWLVPSSLLDALGTQLPLILVSWVYGPGNAGLYALSARFLSVPVALIGTAAGNYLRGEFSVGSRRSASERLRLYRQVQRLLVVLATLMVVGVVLIAPWIIDSLLGPQWEGAKEIVSVLALGAAVNLLWNPVSALLIARGRERLFFSVIAVRLSLVLLGAATAQAVDGGILLAVALMTGGQALAEMGGVLIVRSGLRSWLGLSD